MTPRGRSRHLLKVSLFPMSHLQTPGPFGPKMPGYNEIGLCTQVHLRRPKSKLASFRNMAIALSTRLDSPARRPRELGSFRIFCEPSPAVEMTQLGSFLKIRKTPKATAIFHTLTNKATLSGTPGRPPLYWRSIQ